MKASLDSECVQLAGLHSGEPPGKGEPGRGPVRFVSPCPGFRVTQARLARAAITQLAGFTPLRVAGRSESSQPVPSESLAGCVCVAAVARAGGRLNQTGSGERTGASLGFKVYVQHNFTAHCFARTAREPSTPGGGGKGRPISISWVRVPPLHAPGDGSSLAPSEHPEKRPECQSHTSGKQKETMVFAPNPPRYTRPPAQPGRRRARAPPSLPAQVPEVHVSPVPRLALPSPGAPRISPHLSVPVQA